MLIFLKKKLLQQRQRQLQQLDQAQLGQQQQRQRQRQRRQQFQPFTDVCRESSNVATGANVFRKDLSATENINVPTCRMKSIVLLRRISNFLSEFIRQNRPSEKEEKLCFRQVRK